MAATPLLRLDGVVCRLGNRVLWPAGLRAAIGPGVTWVGGDEGTGKSTLLRVLAGAVQPSQGQVMPTTPPPRLAWVDPVQPLGDQATVREALAQGLLPYQGGNPAELQRLLLALDLEPHLDKAVFMLSTGSRRKVGVAITLASGADVLLFDQPFMALDRPSEQAIVTALAQLTANGQCAAVVADYLPPPGLALAGQIDLDQCV